MKAILPSTVAVAAAASLAVLPVLARTPVPTTAQKTGWTVKGEFEAKSKNGVTEYNISGIACVETQSPRNCLVIDDELASAQRAVVDEREIKTGDLVQLLGADQPVGRPPELVCDEEKKPTDLDGEAVAEANGVFYVIGSHGCSSKGKFSTSSFTIARVSPNGRVGLSYRVSEALTHCPVIDSYFGKRIQDVIEDNKPPRPDLNGINIEGLAVVDGRLWIGLRAPSVLETNAAESSAYIVSMGSEAPFGAKGALGARLHSVRLVRDRGIRDLARLSDGRLLILSGPRTDVGSQFGIEVYDQLNGTTVHVTKLPQQHQGNKAEAMLVLHEARGVVDLLILQDGARNGGPFEVRVTVPARGAAAPTGERPCAEAANIMSAKAG